MSIFDVLNLFGGLAMFLYGMRLMGDGMKESSSGTLKVIMEKVTNNAFKAFLLGLAVTALIQSSTATIVITSGLVAAGIITLRQSLGIVLGANVGTTVTGQIIRLLDLDSSSVEWLQLFKPSTLAPVALIIGIILIMGVKFKNSKVIGNILIGFGILFSGLLNMTNAVDSLAATGVFERVFTSLGSNPWLGYAAGATVAFILQSSSATIGILQALSSSGQLLFKAVYAVIVGVYLGDCTTTAIVCSIGAKADAKRVGMFNIIYNMAKTVLVLAGVTVFHMTGMLDGIWDRAVTSGIIADANTIFNLASALILLPATGIFEKAACRIVKIEADKENKYADVLEALNPNFSSTPALALRSCYNLLMAAFEAARSNLKKSFVLLRHYDDNLFEEIRKEEENIDMLTDRLSDYMSMLSGKLEAELHTQILNEYYKVVVEFERLGDHALNIAEIAQDLNSKGTTFSAEAFRQLDVLVNLISKILDHTEQAFAKRNADAASSIEPMEEVVDDLVITMKSHHLSRISKGECNVYSGTDFMNLLSELERVSDICSDVGLAILTRIYPELANQTHDYIYHLHSGEDERFNELYEQARNEYFDWLDETEEEKKKSD